MKHAEEKDHLPEFIAKMEAEGLSPLVCETFEYYYNQVLTGETGMIFDCDIQPVAPDEIENIENLSDYIAAGKKAYPFAIRIVLNGGLGTSMGLTGPKSLLAVENGQSFLSLILRQADTRAVQLAFMNSFNTHAETLAALKQLNPNRTPLTFIQHKFPKIQQNDFRPAGWPQNPNLEWNPPGHGDVYTALYASGLLEQLLGEGVEYAFAKCCNPIPQDDIFGFITVNKGIKIHRTSCPHAVELLSHYGYRVVNAQWGTPEGVFLVGIMIEGTDRLGMANDVTKIISNEHRVNMQSIAFNSKAGIFKGKVMLFIYNIDHLNSLVERIKKVEGIINIQRFDTAVEVEEW